MSSQKETYERNHELLSKMHEDAFNKSWSDDWETMFWTTPHLEPVAQFLELLPRLDAGMVRFLFSLVILRLCEKPFLKDYDEYIKFNNCLEDILLQKPSMTDGESAEIEKYLSEDSIMLEWGSGYSTPRFGKRVNQIHSIEHEVEWGIRIILYKTLLQLDNVYCYIIPEQPSTENEEINFKEYIEVPKLLEANHGLKKYDVVLIDGKVREFCAKSILPYLHDDSVVIIHDYKEPLPEDRAGYSSVLQWYDEVERYTDGNGFIVLKKKSREV